MLWRSAVPRQAQAAVRQAWQHQRRGLAEPASGSFQYTTGEAQGIKFAVRDFESPVTSLALVSRAGTRFQPLPGLTEGLERFAFKNTDRRSTLRIQRESELLGSVIDTYHSRENIVLGARFLRDDLPYFVELLAEAATMTRFQQHVLNEEIYPLMDMNHRKFLKDPITMASESVHGIAFHRGLGAPLHPNSTTPYEKYLDSSNVAEYAATAYSKPYFSLVANGAESSELSKWINEFFSSIPAQPAYELKAEQTKYYGGEERIAHPTGNAMIMGFAGSSSPTGKFYKPEVSVLAALLGGQSSIKWSPGFSLLAKATTEAPLMHIDTKSLIYSDAGLLTITMQGNPNDIKKTAGYVVQAIKGASKDISDEDFQKAKALAKFKELEYGQETRSAMELTGAGLVHGNKAYQIDEVAKSVDGVTKEKVKKLAKEALEHRASVSTVGDLFVLPYAEEIGLKV